MNIDKEKKVFCDFCDFEYWDFELTKHKLTNKWICVHCKDKVVPTCLKCNNQEFTYKLKNKVLEQCYFCKQIKNKDDYAGELTIWGKPVCKSCCKKENLWFG